MKILLLAAYITDEPGGSGRMMKCLSRSLSFLGHEVIESTNPHIHEDTQYDLIICSHYLFIIKNHPAPKINIAHGIIVEERLIPGANWNVAVSEEVKNHNFRFGIMSTVIPQPIVVREFKRSCPILDKILIIRRNNLKGHDPLLFLCDYYDVRISDPDTPIEEQIDWADLCITLGRGALESMARGKPVIVADNRIYMGAIGDGYVDSGNITEIAKNNFSGRRYQHPITPDWIMGELRKYDPEDGRFLRQYVIDNHNPEIIARKYLSLMEDKLIDMGSRKKGLTSIIIPVYNQHDFTHECIYAVLENTKDYELIIVDNGSDPPYKPPFTGFVQSTVLRNNENTGFPKAVNQGIAASSGEYIILLNNDVIVTPGWQDKLLDGLEDFAIVSPMSNYCAGVQRISIDPYENREELDKAAEQWSEETAGMMMEVNYVIGFCMAFRKETYIMIGKFDDSLWPCSGEEIDFCFRARELGMRVGIVYDCYLHHEGSQTFNDMEKKGILSYEITCQRNDSYLAGKWGKDFWMKQSLPLKENQEEIAA